MISDELFTAGQPDPDLIVRTSGEMRLSNFLTWQSVYSELYFTDVLWPDMNEEGSRQGGRGLLFAAEKIRRSLMYIYTLILHIMENS